MISRAPLSSAIAAKSHRRGDRRIVDRGDIERGAGDHRRRNAVRHRIAEGHRAVVVERRRIAPGAVPLSTSVPLPDEIARLIAVSDGPSTSVALARSWACVISRAPLSSAIAAKVTGVVTGASFTGVMSSVALVATGAATPSRHRIAERHRGVVVERRRIAPGAVQIVHQRAVAGRDRQVDCCQRRSIDIRGVGQELGLRDQPRPAVLGNRRQSHRRVVTARR